MVPLILYVTVIGNDCGLVNVTKGEGSFWQTDVVPLMEAVGVESTVTVAVPLMLLGQFGTVKYCALTRL
jgi:hypothetical protein